MQRKSNILSMPIHPDFQYQIIFKLFLYQDQRPPFLLLLLMRWSRC